MNHTLYERLVSLLNALVFGHTYTHLTQGSFFVHLTWELFRDLWHTYNFRNPAPYDKMIRRVIKGNTLQPQHSIAMCLSE